MRGAADVPTRTQAQGFQDPKPLTLNSKPEVLRLFGQIFLSQKIRSRELCEAIAYDVAGSLLLPCNMGGLWSAITL